MPDEDEKIIQIVLDDHAIYALTNRGEIWWINKADDYSWNKRELPKQNKDHDGTKGFVMQWQYKE